MWETHSFGGIFPMKNVGFSTRKRYPWKNGNRYPPDLMMELMED